MKAMKLTWAYLFTRLLVVGMTTAAAITLLQFGERLAPAWDSAGLAGFAALTALEALISARRMTLARRRDRTPDGQSRQHGGVYRLAEGLLILFALRVFLDLRLGLTSGWEATRAAWQRFPENFSAADYLAAALLTAVVWFLTNQFAGLLAELEEYEAMLRSAEVSALQAGSQPSAHQQLTALTLRLGAGLILIAALTRDALLGLWPPASAAPGPAGHMVVYFVLGLLLLSQSRFAQLHAVWRYERVAVAPGIAGRWARASLFFLLALAVLALGLPTGFSQGFLQSLGGVGGFIISVVSLLLMALFFPLLLALMAGIYWLTTTLASPSQMDIPPLPEVVEIVPEAAAASPAAPATFAPLPFLLGTALLAGVIYALYLYARENGEIARSARRLFSKRWLLRAWAWLREQWGGWPQQAAQAARSGLQKLWARRAGARLPGERWRYLNLRRLTPRQQALFYYLAFVRRSAALGFARQPGQTPDEFAQAIANRLAGGDSEQDAAVQTLTEAFNEARYSRHALEAGRLGEVRQAWGRLRAEMRREKR